MRLEGVLGECKGQLSIATEVLLLLVLIVFRLGVAAMAAKFC